jgi:hypothetical protein
MNQYLWHSAHEVFGDVSSIAIALFSEILVPFDQIYPALAPLWGVHR